MSSGELIIYTTPDGVTNIQLHAYEGMVWLTQSELAELFQTTPQNITLHIKAIYTEGELIEEATCKEYLQVRIEGSRQIERKLKHYSLDVILAIGYRVQTPRGTAFRQWATTHLKEYLVKGFTMDAQRLKSPGGLDYFDELLERIREIRASEKRFYQKVKELYALSADYQPVSDHAKLFFKTVQNKMLWAVTGKTAPELLASRANSTLPNMGLTTWEGSRVRKKDVTVAKNYLKHEEITELNRIVTMFLDFAEDQAKRRQVMYMKDWEERLDAFLKFNERNVLKGAGKISHDHAEEIAHKHYEEFDLQRKELERIQAEEEALEDLKKIEADLSKNKQ